MSIVQRATPLRARAGVRRGAVHPPGPPLASLPGLLRKLAVDRLALMRDTAALGDAVRISMGPKKLYLFNHPDHAKHVLADNAVNYHKGIGLVQAKRVMGEGLLTGDGDHWRAQRRAVQPAFRPARIQAQARAVAQEAARLVEVLRAQRGRGPVDVLDHVTGLTLDVLGRTLLDSDLSGHEAIAHHFEAVQDQAMFEMVTQNLVPFALPLPHRLRFSRARAELRRTVDVLVADRRRRMTRDGGGDDALALMIAAADRGGPRVARRRLHDELITLLLAGHETTASTLAWVLHLLEGHHEVRARVRQEAREVLGDRLPAAEDLHRLTYTTMVVQESMRLYPPVWVLPRVAQQEDTVGGYTVSAGADVLVCPYVLHRHPGLWSDPEIFDPSRFEADRVAGRPRYAYLPFGAGPRFCVGSNLGMMEAVFVTALLVRDLDLRTAPGHRAVPEPMLSLRMRGGLPMTVHPVA